MTERSSSTSPRPWSTTRSRSGSPGPRTRWRSSSSSASPRRTGAGHRHAGPDRRRDPDGPAGRRRPPRQADHSHGRLSGPAPVAIRSQDRLCDRFATEERGQTRGGIGLPGPESEIGCDRNWSGCTMFPRAFASSGHGGPDRPNSAAIGPPARPPGDAKVRGIPSPAGAGPAALPGGSRGCGDGGGCLRPGGGRCARCCRCSRRAWCSSIPPATAGVEHGAALRRDGVPAAGDPLLPRRGDARVALRLRRGTRPAPGAHPDAGGPAAPPGRPAGTTPPADPPAAAGDA